MFLITWYRKIAESADDEFYTREDSKNRKANLVNNILLVPGIIILGLSLTSIFLWFYLGSLIYTARQELPALPYADVSHGMNSVSRITKNKQLDGAIWIAILPGMWAGAVELIGWTQFRHIPFNSMEKIPLPITFTIIILGLFTASFGLTLRATLWSFYLERDPASLTGCVISSEIQDSVPVQVAECTNESIACHVLGWYGVPNSVTRSICRKAKAQIWCMFIIMMCSFLLLVVYGRREWGRRRWMKQQGMTGDELKWNNVKRDEKGIVLPETSVSSTSPPKIFNGWILSALFIEGISALSSGNRVIPLICTVIIFYAFFGGWIEKRFWPSYETEAIEEATSENMYADAIT